jgi:hypothetical protein
VKRIERSRLAELIREAYAEPDSCGSLEDFERFRHGDLPRLSLDDIDRERIFARLAWAVTPEPSAWLRDRLVRLEREATRRRQSGEPHPYPARRPR